MWELDHKEGWGPKNWCFQTMVLEMTLESPLDSKEIKPVNPKGNQPWIFIGRTNDQVETSILWPPDALEKTLMLGKIEGRRRKGQQRMRWLDVSLIQWTWTRENSGRWWGTGRPSVLQSTGSQRVRHNLATEQQQNKMSAIWSCA